MYKFYNPNPKNRSIEDCVIRAIAKVTGQTWDEAFIGITMASFDVKDMPSSGRAWKAYISDIGFYRTPIPNTCPICYTIKNFCDDHMLGRYLLVTDKHLVAVVDGDYYDTWDSGDEIPVEYWQRREK